MATDFQLSSAGVINFGGANVSGWVSNLRLSYSSPTMSIVGANGSSLSSTNPAHVHFNYGGSIFNAKLTSSPSFTDGSSGNSAGQEFGVTNSVNWGYDRPMFAYLAFDASNNIYVFMSPDPTKRTTPSTAAEIGYHSNPSTNNKDTDIFVWTATNVTTSLQSRPCVRIGAFRYTWVGATTHMVVSALGNDDGIGATHAATRFRMPLGQMGAATNKHFDDNGGTAPTYTGANEKDYYLDPNTGKVTVLFHLTNAAGGTAGSGVQALRLTLPYVHKNHGGAFPSRLGTGLIVEGSTLASVCTFTIDHSVSYTPVVYQSTIGSAISAATNNDQSDANRQLSGELIYKAF